MKKYLLLALAGLMVVMALSTNALAIEDECDCGADENGVCLPCDDDSE